LPGNLYALSGCNTCGYLDLDNPFKDLQCCGDATISLPKVQTNFVVQVTPASMILSAALETG
jgi:hypothetical protein